MTEKNGIQGKNQTARPSDPQRICLFGGTFDPIHLGHTHIAAAAVKSLELDRVIFLPCKQSPHKPDKENASEHHRMAMCQLATEELTWAEVDDYDLTAPVPSYSWRTAEAMAARFPNARLFWLMGTDQWEALPRWNRPEQLSNLVEFIVFSRGYDAEPRPGYRMHPIPGNHPASASLIRSIADKGLKNSWLHPAVAEYIRTQRLYLTDQDHSQAE